MTWFYMPPKTLSLACLFLLSNQYNYSFARVVGSVCLAYLDSSVMTGAATRRSCALLGLSLSMILRYGAIMFLWQFFSYL